jgi:hypothetical protein
VRGVSEGITSVLSALGFLNPGLHLMQTLFILSLEQSSQLLRILLITTTLASLAFGAFNPRNSDVSSGEGGGHDGNGKLQIVGHRLTVQRLGCMDLSGQIYV